MAYDKQTWVDGEEGGTPLSAERLNHMEDGIEGAHSAATNIETALTEHEGLADPHSGYQLESEKGQASGYASLDGSGKVPNAQLPALAITATNVVANQAAMLALTAQTGDVAVRTDENKTYILTADDATILANWQELLTPDDTVLSVNGNTGAVTLDATDVGAVPTSDKGIANGVAGLDVNGLVPNAQLPTDIARDSDITTIETTLSSYAMGVVVHGASAGAARPTGFAAVHWIGSVEPTNAINGDVWTDTEV